MTGLGLTAAVLSVVITVIGRAQGAERDRQQVRMLELDAAELGLLEEHG